MLLKTLKSNQPYHTLLVPFIAIGLWIQSFVHPHAFPFYPGEDSMILYQPLSYLLEGNLLLNNIVALIFIILLAFLILKLNLQYTFIRIRSVLPAIVFILITSGMRDLHAMHPVYPATLFLLLTIDRIFDAYENETIHSNAFDAGIYLSIGSLFYMNLVFFFPLLWFGFIILKQKVNWREYFLTAIGFVLPWLAALAYYLIAGKQEELTHTIQLNFTSHPLFLRENLPILIYVGYLVLLTLLGSYFLLSQYADKRISSRKYFKVFFWIFLISVIIIAANRAVSQEIILLLALPLTYLISNYFISMKHQGWGEVFIYLLTAAVVTLQFV